MSDILVVGSVAYDSITTPWGSVDKTLGGSANYFSLAASLFSKVRVVGVVGDDYKAEDLELLTSRNVDVSGLQQVAGETFQWVGQYENDMNEAKTLNTRLNVFESFRPILPESYQSASLVFLANIDPVLQMEVLGQVRSPRILGADSMNFWIKSKKEELIKVFSRVDVVLINEGEARDLVGHYNLVAGIKEIAGYGPKAVVIKRGEYGFLMFTEGQYFSLPSFPVEKVVDPTGAGDTFAGGFFGYLSKVDQPLSRAHLKQACIHGCLLASFTVQDFGVSGLKGLTWPMVEERLSQYRSVIDYLN